jgi:hypothetical protein
MFIPVLYISSLIHIFSTDYMSEDPANCVGKTINGYKTIKLRGHPKAYDTKLYPKGYKWLK